MVFLHNNVVFPAPVNYVGNNGLILCRAPTRPYHRHGGNVIQVVRTLVTRYPEIVCRKRKALECKSYLFGKVQDMSRVSLVVGTGNDVTSLHDQILLLTKDHEVQTCRQEECLELCNIHSYLLIWIVMPVITNPSILGMTSSIRYASKCNKSTVIIGVSGSSLQADLRLHGIDEIIIKPVLHRNIREKYSKWTSVQLFSQDGPDCIDFEDKVLTSPSTPMTPMTPVTPRTPATPATPCTPASNIESNIDETDRSSFSLSMDSGIESPSPVPPVTPLAFQSVTTLRSFTPLNQPSKNRQTTATDHTTKEKMRRERIKDSCDQLRVLLPYIRGRKTDMASILEMCVEYLKIVNAALPQEIQNQIVDILSKNTTTASPQGVKNSVRKLKREQHALKSPTCKLTSSLLEKERCTLPQMKVDNYLCDDPSVQGGCDKKRDLTKPEVEFQQRKRFRIQIPSENFSSLHPSPSGSATIGGIPQLQTLPPIETVKLPTKQDLPSIEQPGSYIHLPGHAPLYGDVDTSSGGRLFGNHVFTDTFPATSNPFFNSPLTKQQPGGLDRDPYGVYLDTHSVFQYYGNVGNYNLGVGPFTDYVNPNSVLSMTDSRKYKPESPKHDDHDGMCTFSRIQSGTSTEDQSSTI